MKLNEVIELNGKEYTVELNRESIVKIEQYTNTKEIMEKLSAKGLEDKSQLEISDDENPFADKVNEEQIQQIEFEKLIALKKLYSRAFWIWLYPVEKLNITQINEIIEKCFEKDETAEYITLKYKEFTEKSVEIRQKYLEEQKNLKALTK